MEALGYLVPEEIIEIVPKREMGCDCLGGCIWFLCNHNKLPQTQALKTPPIYDLIFRRPEVQPGLPGSSG